MYSQSNFFYGGINTDDEDRFLPKGDYRDAFFSRNYGINTSDEGALQSMTGNFIRQNPNRPFGVNVVIGACEDPEGKGSDDSGNLILFVYNTLKNHSIWRYNVQSTTYTKILESSLLNFQLDNKIYHAAVVDGKLYWTDNYFASYEYNEDNILQFNPPRKINIQKAIHYTESGGTNPLGYSEITFEVLDWIKYPPIKGPFNYYYTDETETSNYLKNKLFQFRYQYVYDDNEESAWSPISKLDLPSTSEYISGTVNIDPYKDNTIGLIFRTGSSIVKTIRFAYRIGNTGEFFVYKEFQVKEMGWSPNSVEEIPFKNEISGPAISNSERNYDLVPQVAKTIEYLPSNEFAIGNGVEGYDKLQFEEGDIVISHSLETINDTAFTMPLADYVYFYDSSISTFRSIISLNNIFGNTFKKFRFEVGDKLTIQLKYRLASTASVTYPTKTLHYTFRDLPDADDLALIYRATEDLVYFLQENGVNCSLIPAGTYSVNGDLITWATVGLNAGEYVWYNLTQSQLTSTSGYVKQMMNVLRENKSTRTFKSGSKQEFAIQFYDRANRDSTACIFPLPAYYVPFYTDYDDVFLNDPASAILRKPYINKLKLNIGANVVPPNYATHYQILHKPSTNIANFQQRSVKRVVMNQDTTVTLLLENYYKQTFEGASINQTPSQGDFVRFVRQRANFTYEDQSQSVGILVHEFDQGSMTVNVFEDITISPLMTLMSGNPIGYFNPSATGDYVISYQQSFFIDWNLLPNAIDFTIEFYLLDAFSNVIELESFQFNDIHKNSPRSINFTSYQNLDSSNYYVLMARVKYNDVVPLLTGFKIQFLNSKLSYQNSPANYNNFHYYPKYVTNDINIPQELNVLKYDPAGGPDGEETITVNFFDPSLLGPYLSYTGSNDQRTIASGGFQIEIYTPKKEGQNDPWREVGIENAIVNPHTPERYFSGDVDQVPGSVDCEVYLDCGDVYIRQRYMATGYKYDGDVENIYDANDNNAAWFCEDPHYSDFYISDWNNQGRLAIYSPFAKRQRLKATIYHTKQLLDETQVNGLSRVEFQDQIQLREEQGEINKLIQLGDVLKAFQDRKVTSVYIQKTFALNGDGTNNVIVTDRTFGAVRPHDDDYGTIHPGSVSRVENDVYFYDYYNSAFVVVNQGGMFNICETDKKFSKGVRDLTARIAYIPNYGGYKNANIWSHINRNNNEYTFYVTDKVQNTLPEYNRLNVAEFRSPHTIFIFGDHTDIFTDGFEFFVSGASNASNNAYFTANSSTYDPITNYTNIRVYELVTTEVVKGYDCYVQWYDPIEEEIKGEALCYSYERQRWITRYAAGAIFATQFGARAYSTGGKTYQNFGCLYEENLGAELSFWNEARVQEIDFVFNDQPLITKRFLTHLQQSNRPFRVDAVAPITVRDLLGNYKSETMSTYILDSNLKQQEGYFVSRYFRDTSDPKYILEGPVAARINGRELRGYVLRHKLTYSSGYKSILMNVSVNYVPSEPLIQ